MTWRAMADRVLRDEGSGTLGPLGPIGGVDGANVPIVPNVPIPPARALKAWRSGLAGVDPRQPPTGYDLVRWQSLCEDAVWLLGGYGEQAARDGWSSADLFGLWPDKPHWGGIADRLRGSRAMVLTADRAHWRSFGVVERFNRGSYPELRPLWGLAK